MMGGMGLSCQTGKDRGPIGRSWFDVANTAEDALSRLGKRSKADIIACLNGGGAPLWTILPGSDPGEHRPYLLVMIDQGLEYCASDEVIPSVLQKRLEQVKIYATRVNPNTEGIMIFITQPYFGWRRGREVIARCSWSELWCRYRAIFASVRPDMKLRVAFSRRRREGQYACYFDTEGNPVGATHLLRWWHQTSYRVRDLFRQRVCLLRHLGVQPDLHGRFLEAGHQVGLEGCASVPALDFGKGRRKSSLQGRDAARLCLAPDLDLPIVFDGRCYNGGIGMDIHSSRRSSDEEGFVWRPADMTLFAQDPGLWLNRQGVFF